MLLVTLETDTDQSYQALHCKPDESECTERKSIKLIKIYPKQKPVALITQTKRLCSSLVFEILCSCNDQTVLSNLELVSFSLKPYMVRNDGVTFHQGNQKGSTR